MSEEKVKIAVEVHPNASRNQVIRFDNGVLNLRIAAPPVKGQANTELLKFLSSIFNVPRSNLAIEKGASVRRKVVTIKRLTPGQVVAQIQKLDR